MTDKFGCLLNIRYKILQVRNINSKSIWKSTKFGKFKLFSFLINFGLKKQQFLVDFPTVTSQQWKNFNLLNFLNYQLFPHSFLDEFFDTTFSLNIKILGLENYSLLPKGGKNRTRHLKCKGNSCDDFTILHLGWLEYPHYQFIVTFFGLNHKRYNIEKLTFYVSF